MLILVLFIHADLFSSVMLECTCFFTFLVRRAARPGIQWSTGPGFPVFQFPNNRTQCAARPGAAVQCGARPGAAVRSTGRIRQTIDVFHAVWLLLHHNSWTDLRHEQLFNGAPDLVFQLSNFQTIERSAAPGRAPQCALPGAFAR